MKEIILSTWIAIGSLLGIESEKSGKSIPMQEIPPTVAAESLRTKGTVNSTQEEVHRLEYAAPDEAPWWAPVKGFEAISETTKNGQEGQVSTIWGNGTEGQNERSMDHPRDLGVDSKGRIYFVDGSQHTAKLRVFDGKKNTTIVDLVNNKVSRREGYFATSGLAIIHDNVYISSVEDLYKVVDGRITQLTPKIKQYMDDKNLSNIYRIEKHKDFIYMMFMNKSRQFHIARYNINGGAVEEIMQTKPLPSPYNFYVHGDNEIFISTTTGYIIWEILFPRETKIAWDTEDNQVEIADVWIGSNDSMYYVQWEEGTRAAIYKNPVGIDTDAVVPVAGSRRGFTDGISDEVEMDFPIDFVWDGTGYLFGDMGNNAIRKLWTNVGPMVE